jgi:hypothetical protein
MRRIVPLVMVAWATAAPLSADTGPEDPEIATAAAAVEPAMAAAEAPVVVQEAPAAPELRLDPVQVERSTAADEAEAAQWPQRGSFWWLVGVIVVAGVLLALLL